MARNQPGSGGPYADLQYLRFHRRQPESQIRNGPARRRMKRELKNLKIELKAANAVVRELRKPKAT